MTPKGKNIKKPKMCVLANLLWSSRGNPLKRYLVLNETKSVLLRFMNYYHIVFNPTHVKSCGGFG